MKSKFLYFVFIVFFIIVIVFWFQTRSVSQNIPSSVNQGPKLKIEVLEYPQQIETYCDVANIKIKVKNIGNQELSYHDLLDNKYRFYLHSGNTNWPVWMKIGIDDRGSLYNSTIDDFGVILPNQEKILIIKSGSPTAIIDSEGFSHFLRNIFASLMEDTRQNGNYKFSVQFMKIESDNRHPLISSSDTFTVKSRLFANDGQLKDCSLLHH